MADAYGRLWYATQKGHIGYIKDDTVTPVPNPLQGHTAIRTLLFRSGKLYLGTSDKGIWFSDNQGANGLRALKGSKRLASNNINQLIFDAEGHLWAGTEKGVSKNYPERRRRDYRYHQLRQK